ncbi:hypothetical protein Rsub_13049 [Raphidocelis subcapitata]|uniref:Uncharacterized protein n=1 Tax=Raphidocelis subcapitata TaxID=307507 RepID=A0A2V0PKQ1_9CHLO|nr:hypothetical protein Rsub_13049 [Raphidocelis subcapitata]|eukprot:GBG00297.1 hypothetical protein Rsub_13049 [Raphidocelis subcapitata]
MEAAPADMEGVVVEEAPAPPAAQQQQQADAAAAAPPPDAATPGGGKRVSPFTFQPALVLGDLVNTALETCADAFDRLEEAVAGVTEMRPEHRRALLEGVAALYEFASGSLDAAGTNFQRLAEAAILRVPPELYLEQEAAAPPPAPVTAEEEAALDADLDALRRQVEEAKQGCAALRGELRALSREIASASAAPPLGPLSAALGAARGALLDDAASIGGALLRLGPMLARARDALAADAAGGAAGAGGKAPSAADAAVGAQRRIAAAQQDTGASVDQLQALAESLTATA